MEGYILVFVQFLTPEAQTTLMRKPNSNRVYWGIDIHLGWWGRSSRNQSGIIRKL